MRKMIALIVLALLLAQFPTFGQSPISDPSTAVVAIITVDIQTNTGPWFGTGALVGSSGIVLTNAHIAYHVLHEPHRYRLLVIVGREFYSASVVCSSELKDWTPEHYRPQRDLAVLKLAPADFPFTGWAIVKGDPAETFHAHTDPLPAAFPALSIADRAPATGSPVLVRGWGGSPARPLTTYGTVDRFSRLPDGTPVMAIQESTPGQHGLSGAAVLDEQRRVVGQVFWGTPDGRTLWATDASELRHPCGSVNL